ncbi:MULTISPECIES: hypothetical protein [Rhizobium/Agrobacterium group]|uniref:hypothetical protein n=1 Tax=Rhizobium/Agrobacterium group TaxID=227290 RepID=UPI0013006193|nr:MULTISPECIES: hypothetical protein [Rhizobium/Agrobacterium group]CAD7055906.1 hypothetical protein RP007_01620 [Rhizobium sp. P007]
MMDGQGGSYIRNEDGSLTLVSRTEEKQTEAGLSEAAAEAIRENITGSGRKPKENKNG